MTKIIEKKAKKKPVRRGYRDKYVYWISEDGLTLIRGWARDGYTNEEIARKMKTTAKTLYEWQKKYSVIREALKESKEIVDNLVEQALLKRAMGFTKMVDGKEVYYPPDTTAMIYWSKNRRPEKWREKQEQKIDMDAEIVVKLGVIEEYAE